ncbi:MAG: peptidoglycan DD-metalloendopeptidase family protein [Erysipelothrix sp.]|nr:peptidoglycan DD-metalloendopeptidase family protein [Erysipelothrix sp.]
MKRFSKVLITILSLLLLLIVPQMAFAVSDSEFEANEAYYKELCFGTISTVNKSTCASFAKYLENKVSQQQSSIKDLELEIDDVQNNISEYVKDIQAMEDEIEQLEAEIAANELEVERLEANIEVLNKQIEDRQAEIDQMDENIKTRMASMQSSLHTNNEISFLFGAKDFSDFIRRSSVMNMVTNFDQEQIDAVTKMREQLKAEQDEVARQQQLVEETIVNNLVQKDSLDVAKRNHELVVAEFKKQEAALLEKQMAAQGAIKLAQSERSAVTKGIADLEYRIEQERIRQEQEQANNGGTIVYPELGVGDGWIFPVNGRFKVTAGAWYYPASFGGGIHYGVDMASSIGTPIVSTGPGVVIIGYNGCPTWGYLGSTCGYRSNWGGNQVIVVVSMPNGLYALTYAHLQNAAVSAGTVISKGTVLGTMGSSGNSTGSHLHHEVMYLGDYELSDYLNNVWNGSINFTPNGAWMNLAWACTNKGAPCRVNPQQHYGLTVGAYY